MNAVGLFFQQVQPVTSFKGKAADLTLSEGSSVFQQLLSMEQITEDIPADDLFVDLKLASIDDVLSELTELLLGTLEELYELLTGNAETKNELSEDEKAENLVLLIGEMLSTQGEQGILLFQQLLGQLQTEEQSSLQLSVPPMHTDTVKVLEADEADQATVQRQFTQVFAQAEALLANLSDEQDLSKISPRILELLEKWTALEGKYNLQLNEGILPAEGETESEELGIWKEMVHAFQKRNQLVANQQYNTSAQVTSKDIAKWLQNGLNAQTAALETPVNVASLPMSKVEQYVIHINQAETAEPVAKQLIDQFQTAMKTNRFLSMNNGVNQLSIALRPDNLGEMMVRLTEINGEMTLKIIVSSQATRQMLETNIHQLKSMFSPHQVVIEEQEASVQETQKQYEEQKFDEHEEDRSHQSNKDEAKEFDGDFEMSFHDLLMNEKV